MARSKVYEDKYGIFVRTGGFIFRPDFPVEYKHLAKDCGSVKAGDSVNASHIRETMLANVKNPETGAKEVWYSHGCYYGYSLKNKTPSEELYRPWHDRWI